MVSGDVAQALLSQHEQVESIEVRVLSEDGVDESEPVPSTRSRTVGTTRDKGVSRF